NREAQPPVDLLAHQPADQGRNQRADVDSHIEDGKAGIAPRVAGTVKLADDHAYIRLQQSGADHQQAKPGVEDHYAGGGQAEVAGRDKDAAVKYGAALAGNAVGHPAAAQADQVDHGRIEAVNRARLRYGEAETAGGRGGGHEENEERARAVIAVALPHLREKQRGQTARMPEKTRILPNRRFGFGHAVGYNTAAVEA